MMNAPSAASSSSWSSLAWRSSVTTMGTVADDRAHAPDDLGLGLRHAGHRHRAVQREVHAVVRPAGLDVVRDAVGVLVEGLLRDPAARRAALRVARRQDALRADAIVLPGGPDEPADVAALLQHVVALHRAGRRTPTRRCPSGSGQNVHVSCEKVATAILIGFGSGGGAAGGDAHAASHTEQTRRAGTERRTWRTGIRKPPWWKSPGLTGVDTAGTRFDQESDPRRHQPT